MKFLLVPDSFKESLTSIEACNFMEKGIKSIKIDANCIKVPIADGGEGSLESFMSFLKGKVVSIEVMGPLETTVNASIGIVDEGNTAIIEMAKASGLMLIEKKDRNPLFATSYGTGQLIKKGLDMNVKEIIIAIGGSATNDGGVGMLKALGVSFKDKNNKEIKLGGKYLKDINYIDISNLDKRLHDTKIIIACDVTNPLIGEEGATKVFGPQKGANSSMIDILEEGLKNYASLIKNQFLVDVSYAKGAGAAGGMGAALMTFLNGEMVSGIDLIIEKSKLEEKILDADYIFTGEGSIDNQTMYGKAIIGISKIAKKHNKPVIAFCGKIGKADKLYENGVTSIFSILQDITTLNEALKNGGYNLQKTVENVVRLL